MSTNDPKPAIEWRTHIPQGFNGPATTPLEALIRGQFVLFEEDRWVKSAWFDNEHPEEDPEDPFCNDWQVCAAGAVLMVSVGAARRVERLKWKEQSDVQPDDKIVRASNPALDDPDAFVKVLCPIPKDVQSWGILWPDEQDNVDTPEGWDVYQEALEFLRAGAVKATGRVWSDVPTFNDASMISRTEVLKAFSQAIALAAKAEGQAETAQAVAQSAADAVLQGVVYNATVSVESV
jgi:hypothetical protein